MKSERVIDLLQRGESQTLEFKKSLSCLTEGLEALCGMVNADAAEGTVVFGIRPDGAIVGVEPGNLDTAQRSVSQKIGDKFEPRVQFVVEVVQMDERRLLVVEAQRSKDVPYHEFDGRAFIREGTVTRQLSLTEKQSLQRKRNRDSHPGPWRCDKCGSWVGMLSAVQVTDQGMRKTYRCECGGEFWPAT